MRRSRTNRFRPIFGAIVLVLGFHLSSGTQANNEPGENEPGQADDRRQGNDRSVGHFDHTPYETAADFFSAFLQTGNWFDAADRANNGAFQRARDFERARDTHRLYLIKTRESAIPATPAQETHIRDNLVATIEWRAFDQPTWNTITYDQPPAAKNYALPAIARDDVAGDDIDDDDLIAIFRSQRTF